MLTTTSLTSCPYLDDFTKEKKTSVKPPFPNLEIFNVSAVILGWYGFDDEVKDLLWQLSPKTRQYFFGHRNILSGFVIAWKPDVTNLASFGY